MKKKSFDGYKGAVADSVYYFNWLVYAGCDHQAAVNHYCAYYNMIPWQSDSEGAEANFFGHTGLKSYGLWFRHGRPKTDILAHEVFHAIVMMAEKLNMNINKETEETFAYYQQMLYREIKKILR